MEKIMAAKYASWVHGCAVVPELMGNPPLQFPPNGGGPFSDVNGFRQAFGVSFRIAPNSANWFHIPIPTPVFLEDKQATLGSVFALFRIDGGRLDHVLVFDGARIIFDRPGLDISGDHSGGLDNSNSFVVNHDAIGFGVCFSLHFAAFGSGADLHIATAGGDFFHNI